MLFSKNGIVRGWFPSRPEVQTDRIAALELQVKGLQAQAAKGVISGMKDRAEDGAFKSLGENMRAIKAASLGETLRRIPADARARARDPALVAGLVAGGRETVALVNET